MPILLAMLVAGSAFAGNVDYDAIDAALRDPKNIGNLSASERAKARPAVPGGVELAKKAAEAQATYAPSFSRSSSSAASSTSYSIVTLPNGQTASVLTFK